MNDSLMDDRYFYNPLNSLSITENNESMANMSFNNSSMINQNPAVMAKRADTVLIDQSVDRSTAKLKTLKLTSPMSIVPSQSSQQQIVDVKLPEIPIQKLASQPAQFSSKQIINPITNQNNNVNIETENYNVVKEEKEYVGQGNASFDYDRSTRKKQKIFDSANNSVFPIEKSLYKSGFKSAIIQRSDNIQQEHHVVTSMEELLIAKSLFFNTNYTEKNADEFIQQAKQAVEKLNNTSNILNKYMKQKQEFDQYYNRIMTPAQYLVGTEEERQLEIGEEFKMFSVIVKDQAASIQFVNIAITDVFELQAKIQQELKATNQLTLAISNLEYIKSDVHLLKNNQHLISQFQMNLDVLKKAQKFLRVNEKLWLDQIALQNKQSCLKLEDYLNNLQNTINNQQ